MSWATPYINKLKSGETVCFRPRGHSMTGRINSGQKCTVEPIGDRPPAVDEIVLCTVRGSQYLHLIKAVSGPRYQIGNNKGHINGWVGLAQIHGRCAKIED